MLAYQTYLTGLGFAAIKLRLTLSFNDANKDEDTITSDDGVAIHLLMPYATDDIKTKVVDEARILEQGLLLQ